MLGRRLPAGLVPQLDAACSLITAARSGVLPQHSLNVRSLSWRIRATPAYNAPNRTGNTRSSDTNSSSSSSSSSFQGKSRSSRATSGRPSTAQHWQQPRQQQQQQQHRKEWTPAGEDNAWDDNYDNDAEESSDYLYPARPSKASYRDQLFGEALYGVAPILAALKAGKRQPHVLLMQEGLTTTGRKDGRALQDIQRLVNDAGLTVRTVSKHELNMLSGNRPHQGLILDVSPLQWQQLEVLPTPEELQQQQQQQQQQEQQLPIGLGHPVWLALDEVVDPQNLGAMLRSAYCLGASGVLACSRNCSPLTPVVSKASAGAAEVMTLHTCRSMPRTLADAAARGWAVVGASAEKEAVPVSQFKVDQPTVLVMGNEGYGLRVTVKRCCTQLVQIEMSPPSAMDGSSSSQHLVDSLNVSVATGILLHQLITAASRPQ